MIGAMRLWLVMALALVACRANFDPTTRTDAARSQDAVDWLDAPLAPYCTPLGDVVTVEQCAAARADPAGTPDQVLFDCADACALGACVLFEGPADGCSTCACDAYIKTSIICDAGGLCGAPLNGTGCITQGSFT